MLARLILILLFLAIPTSAQTSFKVWVANVQHGVGTDSATNYTRQANILKGSSADIVCMQERSTGDTGWDSPMSGFTEAIYRENGHGNDGPSIWIKNSTVTLHGTQTVALSTGAIGWDGSTNVDKAAVAVDVTIGGKRFWIINTHLAWSAGNDCNGCATSSIREGQINTLLSWIATITAGSNNYAVFGDMNFTPTTPKISGGFQIDLFTGTGLVNGWEAAIIANTAIVNWGDRNSDGIQDMPKSVTLTRTHDTRYIDYVFYKSSATAFALQSIEIPDLRATCPHALVNNGGNLPACTPEVNDNSVQGLWDIEDDFGVRPSDHNFILATFNLGAEANFSCPSTAFVGEPVVCDGTSSINVHGQQGWSTQTFSNGTSPVLFDFGDGLGTYSTSKLLKATHVYLTAGTYNINLTVKDSNGNSNSEQRSITISDIPAATGGNIQVLSDQGSTAANCTALQNAINAARANNTTSEQEIHLPAQTVLIYTCQLTIGDAVGNKYVTVRPISMSGLPNQTTRIIPATHASLMPKIVSPGTDLTTITITPGANKKYIRFLGIEFAKQPTGHLYQFFEIGSGITTYANLPHHIIIDRCYLHGTANTDMARAVFANADNFSLLNSHLQDFHDSGADAQSVAGFTGAAHGIINNWLDGYGEGILYGGANTGIVFQTTASSPTPTSATLASVSNLRVGDGISFSVSSTRGPWSATIVRSIAGNNITFDQITNQAGTPTAPDTTSNSVKYGSSPQDIVIERNYIFKSFTFRVADPSYAGHFAVVKNSIEFKHAMRVKVDGNIIQNMWGNQGQSGPTILITPRNQTCYLLTPPNDPTTCPEQTNPWTMTRDIQITNNKADSIPNFLNILGTDNINAAGEGLESGPSAYVQYILVENNLLTNIDNAGLEGQIGALAFIFPGAAHLTINHHTMINISGSSWLGSTDAPIGSITINAKVLNNIVRHRDYGIIGDGFQAKDFVNRYFPDGLVTHNVQSDELTTAAPSQWVAPRSGPNYFPSSQANLFVNFGTGNFRLTDSSPFKAGNATPASDGLDIGVNLDTILSSTANTTSGAWGIIKKCNWHGSCN